MIAERREERGMQTGIEGDFGNGNKQSVSDRNRKELYSGSIESELKGKLKYILFAVSVVAKYWAASSELICLNGISSETNTATGQ